MPFAELRPAYARAQRREQGDARAARPALAYFRALAGSTGVP